MSEPRKEDRSSLRATYRAATASQTLEYPLQSSAASANQGISEKTAYLSELRSSVSNLQTDVNALLTSKMEQDKAAAGESAATGQAVKGKVAAAEAKGEAVEDGLEGEDGSEDA